MKKKSNTSLNWLQKARNSWANTGSKRPTFAVTPKKDQRSVWDFPRPPSVENVQKHIVIKYNGIGIASSSKALAVLETASPPTYYIPKDNINMNLLEVMGGKTSLCEWKGKATYYTLKEATLPAVAWCYEKPFHEFVLLQDHLAFYPQQLECYINDELVTAQASQFYAGWITKDIVGPFKGDKGTEHW